jgi:four helix bundle protein
VDPKQLRDRSQKLAIGVDRFCDTLPRDPRSQRIAKQLHDSAHSAAINDRAVCCARSDDEFIAKICRTVEEADETKGWLQTLVRSGRAQGPEVGQLLDEATQLVKIFAKSKSTAIRNAKRRKRERETRQRSEMAK